MPSSRLNIHCEKAMAKAIVWRPPPWHRAVLIRSLIFSESDSMSFFIQMLQCLGQTRCTHIPASKKMLQCCLV